jgi:hypothetical protein
MPFVLIFLSCAAITALTCGESGPSFGCTDSVHRFVNEPFLPTEERETQRRRRDAETQRQNQKCKHTMPERKRHWYAEDPPPTTGPRSDSADLCESHRLNPEISSSVPPETGPRDGRMLVMV